MANTNVNGSECCPETTATNPKALLRNRSRMTGLHLYQLQNPIPAEIEDTDDLKAFFKKWRFIPYAGTTKESGQSLLIWYLMLWKLSPTHNACINKKVKYAVGSKVSFIRSQDPEFEITDELRPLSVNEQKAYRDTLNEFFEFEYGIGQFHRNIALNLEATGNALVEMSFSTTLGVTRFFLKVHRPTHWLYLETKPDEQRVVVISPVWTDQYLNKHEPRYLPLSTPQNIVFAVDEKGVYRTAFHLKTGTNNWYGRPESEGSDVYKYREVQDEIYLVKEAGSNFTGRVIIEIEDTDPEYDAPIQDEPAENENFENFAQRFRVNFTHDGGNPQSVLVTSRPYGSRPMEVFQVKPNTNQDWYKVTGEIAEEKITRSHGLTRGFMGFDVQHGFSTDVFISDYIMNNQKSIDDLRERVTRFTNLIITEGLKIVNRESFNQYSITFATPIQGAIDDFKNAKNQVQNIQPGNSGEPNNTVRGTEIQPGR